MRKYHISNNIPMSAQISLSNSEMLKLILEYYTEVDSIIYDVTYGLGNFWKEEKYRNNLHFSDIEPIDGIKKMDYNRMDAIDSSIDCIVFDPPYLGIDIRNNYFHSNKNGFAGIDSKVETKHIIGDNIFPEIEFKRVLKQEGIIIYKNSKPENETGFSQIDLFLSVTPQVLAFPSMKHSRQNYSCWHVLKK